MGEKDTATAIARQKRPLRRQIALAAVIALTAAYALPYWVAEGPRVFVITSIVVIAIQLFAIAHSSYQLWKLRGAASAGDVATHEGAPQG